MGRVRAWQLRRLPRFLPVCCRRNWADPAQRGCQLSLLCKFDIMPVYEKLLAESVIVDIRKPDTFRVSPAPLYNTFSDVAEFVTVFTRVIEGFVKA